MLIPLKLKYLSDKSSGTGGKTSPRTAHGAKKEGLAALMENERARDLHFMDCALQGWYEQIPTGQRERYLKRAS